MSSYIAILYFYQLPEGDHVRKVNGGTTDQEVIIPALIYNQVTPMVMVIIEEIHGYSPYDNHQVPTW